MLVKFFGNQGISRDTQRMGCELGSANVTYLSARRQENLTLNWDQAWKNQQARAGNVNFNCDSKKFLSNSKTNRA
jgi:hypothetical protein